MGDGSTSYEVSKRQPSSGTEDDDMSVPDNDVRGVYEVSCPYLNNMRFLDEQYRITRDVNTLMIGSAAVIADEKVDKSIGGNS